MTEQKKLIIPGQPEVLPEPAPVEPAASPEEILRRSRGAQLRAMILSWHLNETYQNTLQIQAIELQDGKLEIDDDWGEMANSILHQFQSCLDPRGDN